MNHNNKIHIRIGKSPDNDCIIEDPHVSRHHAILRSSPEGDYILEDLSSGNGTFVNGQQILRKKITSEDAITFGGKYTTSLSELLSAQKDNFSQEFETLKRVYEHYQAEKVKIQSSNQFKIRLLQSLPFALPGIVGISLSLFGVNKILYISLLITIIGPVIGIIMGARQAAKTPAQLQKLSDQFKIDYVCPECGAFLGEIPWQSLKNRKKCPNPVCKAKW